MFEGYLHGMWGVKVKKKHRASYTTMRIDYKGYLNIVKALFNIVRMTALDRSRAIESMCDVCFLVGKRAGMVVGSLRFRYFSI
jgi:hypothetical protein